LSQHQVKFFWCCYQNAKFLSSALFAKEPCFNGIDFQCWADLLDHDFHPPTVYFPLLVDEALLIEPTETETRETLDAFAEAVAEILREAGEDPSIAQGAPYDTPVRRLDEAGAAKRPVIRQPL